MRLKIFIAVMATAIVMLSCEWFGNKASQQINLQGKWTLDSISEPVDSSRMSGLVVLALAKAFHSTDSAAFHATNTMLMELSFGKDSVISRVAPAIADTIWYRFNPTTALLEVKEDSVIDSLSVKAISDSLITLSSKDSIVMFLRKQ